MAELQKIPDSGRPVVTALDLPESMYHDGLFRDEYMARSIARIFLQEPGSKMLAVLGNNHILKKLDWQDHVPNKHRSIRSYLDDNVPGIMAFSIGQLNDANLSECDFARRFSPLNGSVEMDCDK